MTHFFFVLKYAVVILFTFYLTSMYKEHTYQKKELAYQAALRIEKDRHNKVETNIIKEKQRNEIENAELVQQLRRDLSDNVIALDSCRLNPVVIRLWNKSNKSEGLSKDTTGVVEGTTGTNTTPEQVEGTGIDLISAIENKFENDAICNGLRDQIKAIIRWDLETYGEK